MTMLNGTLTAYEPGPKRNPFVCPECGNTDLDAMSLILVDLDYVRHDYVYTEDGEVAFTYGKSVHAESSTHHDPSMECKHTWRDSDGYRHYCHGTWPIGWDDFNLE